MSTNVGLYPVLIKEIFSNTGTGNHEKVMEAMDRHSNGVQLSIDK